jgi:undecaprenyl-diphosphatase
LFCSASTLAVLGLAVAVVLLALRRWSLLFGLGGAVLVLLIGFSRIYLGVHFMSDVIGGYAAGDVVAPSSGMSIRPCFDRVI